MDPEEESTPPKRIRKNEDISLPEFILFEGRKYQCKRQRGRPAKGKKGAG